MYSYHRHDGDHQQNLGHVLVLLEELLWQFSTPQLSMPLEFEHD
jgi:hypothetical protein